MLTVRDVFFGGNVHSSAQLCTRVMYQDYVPKLCSKVVYQTCVVTGFAPFGAICGFPARSRYVDFLSRNVHFRSCASVSVYIFFRGGFIPQRNYVPGFALPFCGFQNGARRVEIAAILIAVVSGFSMHLGV